MTTYLLQIQTDDIELQLKTEVTAPHFEQLQMGAAEMVRLNPEVIGKAYLVAKCTKKTTGGFDCKTLNKGVIKG